MTMPELPCDRYECSENRFEIARHHRDFARIRSLVDTALGDSSRADVMASALFAISGIVG